MTGDEEERQSSGFTKVLLPFRIVEMETVAHIAIATVPGHRGLKECLKGSTERGNKHIFPSMHLTEPQMFSRNEPCVRSLTCTYLLSPQNTETRTDRTFLVPVGPRSFHLSYVLSRAASSPRLKVNIFILALVVN